MRSRKSKQGISVHAIAGTEVVLLGLDVADTAREGLLGFTIYKSGGDLEGRVALGGGDRVFGVDARRRDRATMRSDRAPIQAFLWSDYVVDPGTRYTYTVIPRYGRPGNLDPEGPGVSVTIRTEKVAGSTHSIYFNRGVAGSQGFARRFDAFRRYYLIDDPSRESSDRDPAEVPRARALIKPETVPDREAYRWLSRGLEEALLEFIGQARNGDYALRAAVYEFTYEPAIQAFVDALERGADVQIVHHAKHEKAYRFRKAPRAAGTATPSTTTTWSEGDRPADRLTPDPSADPRYVSVGLVRDGVSAAAVRAVGRVGLRNPTPDRLRAFDRMLIPRTNTAAISHNKFIVLLKKNRATGRMEPEQVWFGSTNFTAGGIFGQSNVGHVVRDKAIARQYLGYWKELAKDPARQRSASRDPLRTWTAAKTPDLTGPPPRASMVPIFSPRPKIDMLHWYADRIAAARNSVFFTAAFSVDQSFLDVLARPAQVQDEPFLRYVLLESRSGPMWEKFETMRACEQNRIAWGELMAARNGDDDYHQFVETLTGLNDHVEFLHTKYMLVDPLSDDPIVITGSANFSEASTLQNDENMLVIRGDTRVADIFLGEFMRLFNHFHGRNTRNRSRARDRDVLAADASWTDPYFTPGTQEHNERQLFA